MLIQITKLVKINGLEEPEEFPILVDSDQIVSIFPTYEDWSDLTNPFVIGKSKIKIKGKKAFLITEYVKDINEQILAHGKELPSQKLSDIL
jgi:hypothetical protein